MIYIFNQVYVPSRIPCPSKILAISDLIFTLQALSPLHFFDFEKVDLLKGTLQYP